VVGCFSWDPPRLPRRRVGYLRYRQALSLIIWDGEVEMNKKRSGALVAMSALSGMGLLLLFLLLDQNMVGAAISGRDSSIGDPAASDTLTDPEEWEPLYPYGSPPPPKADHTAIYDEANQQMIVFGGCCFLTDVHALDLASGNENWQQPFPPGPSPWLEGGHAAVYDTNNERMIVWGGKHATTDIYTLDLTPCNEKWVTLTVTGTLPEGRTGHAAIYDATNRRMIIFAGYFGEYPYFRNDVWALYLSLGEERWEEIFSLDSPPDPAPPLRSGHTAVYDAANQGMIVFGGVDF
jgi:hypothetical protein